MTEMALQSEMRRTRRRRTPATPFGYDLRGTFPIRPSGILCRERGRELGSDVRWDRRLVVIAGSRPGEGGPTAGREHEARPEEFTGFREFRRTLSQGEGGAWPDAGLGAVGDFASGARVNSRYAA